MLRAMKQAARNVLGDTLLGAIDYFRFPKMRVSWGGPLNGQKHRQALVKALVCNQPPAAIIETGTYRGTTTAFLAELTGCPVHSVEINSRAYGFSRVALRRLTNVYLHNEDSRSFLRRLAQQERLAGQRLLFYLDSHWGSDLPLQEELTVIFSSWPDAVVLIDDFRVPDDDGYGYDDYGPGNVLELGYLLPTARRFNLSIFFPSAPSSEETGAKRGSVTLAIQGRMADRLRVLSELREYNL